MQSLPARRHERAALARHRHRPPRRPPRHGVAARHHARRRPLQLAWMGEPVSQYGDVLVENCPTRSRCCAPPGRSSRRAQARPRVAAARARGRRDRPAHRRARRASPRSGAPLRSFSARDDAETAPLRLAQAPARAGQDASPSSATSRFVQHAGSARRSALARRRHRDEARASSSSAASSRRRLPTRALQPSSPTPPTIASMSTGCRVVALECDGEPAAAEHRHRLQGSHRRARRRLRSTLREGERRHAAARRRHRARRSPKASRTFDLLAPADAYKARLAPTEIGVTDWALPVSRAGAVYARLYLALRVRR